MKALLNPISDIVGRHSVLLSLEISLAAPVAGKHDAGNNPSITKDAKEQSRTLCFRGRREKNGGSGRPRLGGAIKFSGNSIGLLCTTMETDD